MSTDSFIQQGFFDCGQIISPQACKKLLEEVLKKRAFDSSLFLTAQQYEENPVHLAVNPIDGQRNLIEQFALDFVEKNEALHKLLASVLGEHFSFRRKKFVVGLPENAIPQWVKAQIKDLPIANLGAYIKENFRDCTYFQGIDFHQDLIDYKNEAPDFITLYIYLDEVGLEDSPLVVLPGSQKLGATIFPHKLTMNNLTWHYTNDLGNSDTFKQNILANKPAGSAFFWHACTLHGTQKIAAKKPRISLRYIVQKDPKDNQTALDACNQTMVGYQAMQETRVDIDQNGLAILRKNIINTISTDENKI